MTDKELFKLCKMYGSNALTWRRKFESLLPEVDKRKLFRKHNCHNIFEFAAKFGGVSYRVTTEVLRTHRLLKNKEKIREKMEEVGWSKSRVIVPLIETVEEEKIVEMMELPIRPLKEVVKSLIGRTNVCARQSRKINFEIDDETELELKKFKLKLEKQRKQPVTLNEALKELLRQVNSGEAPIGNCARCKNPSAENHHPVRQALTKTKNTIPLCKTCHQLAHSGRILNENDSPSDWIVRIDPDKTDPKYRIDLKVRQHWRPKVG